MIHFYIKFLICFTKPMPPLGKPTKKKVDRQNQKTKKDVNYSESMEKREAKEVLFGRDIIECHEKVRDWCHIEYSLLEDKIPKTEINVVTWGAAAKVYTEGDFRALKTVIIDNFVWVYFGMIHKITNFEDNDIEKLKACNITFTFSQNKTKMMASVTNDWPTQFAVCKKIHGPKPTDDLWFNELRQTDPLDEKHKELSKHRFETFKITQPKKYSIVSMLQVSSCDKKTAKIITEVTSALPLTKDSIDVANKKNRDPKSKKAKKEKGNPKDIANAIKLSVRGELLIAGLLDVSTELRDITSTIRYARIILNTSQVLTDEQINAYVPLIITIQGVEDFPINVKELCRLKNIYARYELYNVINVVETVKIPLINKDISFDDTHVFFMSSPVEKEKNQQIMLRPSIVTLAESLLTQQLVVKLYGEINEIMEAGTVPCLFGEQHTDQFLSAPGHEIFTNYKSPAEVKTEEFLGSASFNLIQLIKGYFKIEVSSAISSGYQSPDLMCDGDDSNDLDEERKIIYERLIVRGCLPDAVLIQQNSRVKIKVTIPCVLTSISELQLLTIPTVFFRLIAIFKDKDVANTFIEHIVRTNYLAREPSLESFRSTTITNLMRSFGTSSRLSFEGLTNQRLTSIQDIRELRKIIMTSPKSFTGFSVHSNEECILVIEATPTIFPLLIEPLHSMQPPECRMVYDTSLFFTKRLYSDFFPLSLYKIYLRQPLKTLLKNSAYYMKNTLPALQALFLLDLLRRTPTLYNACVSLMFPSCNQLINFNKEFGRYSTSSSSAS